MISAARSSHTTYLAPPDYQITSVKDALCGWLKTRSRLPNCVLPDGPCNLLPEVHRELRLVLESTHQGDEQSCAACESDIDNSPEQPFRPSHCATTSYKLTLQVGNSAAENWFISPASAARSVSHYLETALKIRKPQSRVLTRQDLSNSPFEIYIHTQSPGDLLIIPPLWYGWSRRFHAVGG